MTRAIVDDGSIFRGLVQKITYIKALFGTICTTRNTGLRPWYHVTCV